MEQTVVRVQIDVPLCLPVWWILETIFYELYHIRILGGLRGSLMGHCNIGAIIGCGRTDLRPLRGRNAIGERSIGYIRTAQ